MYYRYFSAIILVYCIVVCFVLILMITKLLKSLDRKLFLVFFFFSDFESLDEDTQVVATARGKFTSQGGVLSSPESGVSIVIPEGAIPEGVEQEIYFKVCKDNNFMPPLDSDRGIGLLSSVTKSCGKNLPKLRLSNFVKHKIPRERYQVKSPGDNKP